MSTIAIVGAGPGLGMAIAREFGRHDYEVALLSRNPVKLDGYVEALAADGITAEAFPADVLDHESLRAALEAAARRFGGIDVLEYSPVDSGSPGAPSTLPIGDIEAQLRFQLLGAIAATQAVLPAMRERGSGTLLFTTGAGSVTPVPRFAAANSAGAALRNWVLNLHTELDGTGLYAAHVPIAVAIDAVIPGHPTASAEEIAGLYWRLHSDRDVAERMFAV
jgi:NAD(P)-dependent dehydrogenase (short-subunit alcohol dehydrogenase family)